MTADLLQIQHGIKLNCAFLQYIWPFYSDRFDMSPYLEDPPAKLSDCDFTQVPPYVRLADDQFEIAPAADEPNRMVCTGEFFDIWFEGDFVGHYKVNVGSCYLALLLESSNTDDRVTCLNLMKRNPLSNTTGGAVKAEEVDQGIQVSDLISQLPKEALEDSAGWKEYFAELRAKTNQLDDPEMIAEASEQIDMLNKMYDKFFDRDGKPRDLLKAEARVANTVGRRYREMKKILEKEQKAAAFLNYINAKFHANQMAYFIREDPEHNWYVTLPPKR